MSSSNNDSILSGTNDSSILSSSSQLNSDHLKTPPKQQGSGAGSGVNFSSILQQQQQQQQQAANSSLSFHNEDISESGTPMNPATASFKPHQQSAPSTVQPFLQENSILRTETPDLNINLALGDLNLDDYNDFLSNNQGENRSLMNFGSMTPTQQHAQQRFNPATPNWSSVISVPQTAPPFNHSGLNHSSPILQNIKTFKFPDDDADGETTTSSENNRPSHQFGGSLLTGSNPAYTDSKERSSSESFQSTQDSDSQFSGMMGSQQAPSHPQYPMAFGSMDYTRFAQVPYGAYQSGPAPGSKTDGVPMPPMWGNPEADYNTFMVGGNSGNAINVNDNRGQNQNHHQYQRPNYQGHNNQQNQLPGYRWNNNGVNVHRNKMNNHHRNRKGEDPSKYTNAKLEDFKGDIYSLCKDQHGCRFLQKQLEFDDELKATLIFNETYLHIVELMVDPFGNYLVQKLLEKCNDQQRTVLVKNASSEFYKIAINPHGTRALQKLIECVNSDEEAMIIVESLKSRIVTLSRDLNGNHVVQKCLSKLSQKHNQFIFDISCEHCVEITTHRHGCCVLQRCLDYGSLDQCKQLGSVLSQNVLRLSLDPFGNYVIQYILNNTELIESKDESITKILSEINANFIEFSLHKFGSNVIEKILRLPKINGDLIQLILNDLSIKDFNRLLNDSFGNYVLQTCLDVSNFENFEKLKEILIPILPSVKNTPHGRRISARLGINLSTLNSNNSKENIVPENGKLAEVEG